MKLLVVDDDIHLAKALTQCLTRQGYLVEVASDGQQAWEYVRSQVYDLIVLDVMLPKLDGVSLCQTLRREGYTLPILLLTARSSSSDKVMGLDAGADDWVIKPFDWEELLARIRALLRRESAWAAPVLRWGNLSLDLSTCEVRYGDRSLLLRPREYHLLELFLRNPARVFSCSAILEHLWSLEDLPSEDTVRSHIRGLRQKLRQAKAGDLIETVYGLGYRLKAVDAVAAQSAAPADSALPAPPIQQALQQALAAAWQAVKPDILAQVARLEQSVDALQLDPATKREQAIAEAHKLAGTVGSYGFWLGSQLAHQIEVQLQQGACLPHELALVRSHVAALRQALLGSPAPLPAQPAAPPGLGTVRLLAIDDDPHLLTALQTVLEPWGLSLTVLSNTNQFWRSLETSAPDLLLLDLAMPQLSGIQLCEAVRNHPNWAGLPIVFLTAYTDSETVQRVFQAGADDFVSKPIAAAELLTRVVSRIERYRHWRRMSERDDLTRLLTRTQFSQKFQQRLQTAPQPLCFTLLQIENLQQINHEYGYQAGDAALCYVGTLLDRRRNPPDLVARWSGSKFAIAQPSSPADALPLLHHDPELRAARLTTRRGDLLFLHLRAATAQFPQDGGTVEALYQAAERSLLP